MARRLTGTLSSISATYLEGNIPPKSDVGDKLGLIAVEDFNAIGLSAGIRKLKYIPPWHQHGARNFHRLFDRNAHDVRKFCRFRLGLKMI